MNYCERIVLGAAQFGMPYGITNMSGQPTNDVVASILRFSESVGINSIDTAVLYGESERILGEVGVERWKVSTKLPKIPDDCCAEREWIKETIQNSITKLNIISLDTIFFHHPCDLLKSSHIYEIMCEFKDAGIANKIGISIYDSSNLDSILSKFDIDVVQLPFNVFDRRMINNGWLYRLKEMGLEIHARSIFLQGLLLVNPDELPKSFEKFKGLWEKWHAWLNDNSYTALKACLNYAMAQVEIDKLVVGVNSYPELFEIVNSISLEQCSIPDNLQTNNVNIIDPRRW